MANEEHLAKLEEGVEAWNQWREENPQIKPDLSNIHFNLQFNLNNANLKNTNFEDTKLEEVRFNNANLESANLQYAYLHHAKLANANLRSANLTSAALTRTKLTDAYLYRANLEMADLRSSNFESANLQGANLYRTELQYANFKGANLKGANLYRAGLRYANFEGANLYRSNLNRVQALGTNFESATLTSACIEDWNINIETNFKGVKCDYIYLKRIPNSGSIDFQNKYGQWFYLEQGDYRNKYGQWMHHENQWFCYERIVSTTNSKISFFGSCENVHPDDIVYHENKGFFTERVPHDPDKIFAPGEFEKRYQKILETVDLYFGEGIDWQVFLNSFQKLQEEEKIKIADGEKEIPIVQGIENTGDGSFLIKIGVSPDTDRGKIEKYFWQKYQKSLEQAEIKYKLELNFKDREIEIYHQHNTELIEIIKLKASQPINVIQQQGDNQVAEKRDINIEQGNYNESIKGNYYEQKGNFGIGHMSGGEIKGNAKVAGLINEATQQDLAEAATEIKQLLDQLSQTYPTKTTSEKMAVGAKLTEEIENNPTRWQKLINVIKVMGIEALAEAVDNPIFNIAKAGIEAALESEL